MTVLDTLRSKAERAAAELTKAQDAHAAEQDARAARNRARVAEFWSDAGARCHAAGQALQDARAAVVDSAATGDTLAALTAYGEYVAAVVEYAAIVSMSKAGTATYVHAESRPTQDATAVGKYAKHGTRREVEVRTLVADYRANHDGPPPGSYRTVYADGIPQGSVDDKPVPFPELLAEGIARLVTDHRQTFRAEYAATLAASLEVTDG